MFFKLASKYPELQNQISRWLKETKSQPDSVLEYKLFCAYNLSHHKLTVRHKSNNHVVFKGIELKLIEPLPTPNCGIQNHSENPARAELVTVIQIDEFDHHNIHHLDQFTRGVPSLEEHEFEYDSTNPRLKSNATKARQILEDRILIPFAKQMSLVADKDIESIFARTMEKVLQNNGHSGGLIKDLPDGSDVKTNFVLDTEKQLITIHTVQTYPDKLENIFNATVKYTGVDKHKGHHFKLLTYKHEQITGIRGHYDPSELVIKTLKEYDAAKFVKSHHKDAAITDLTRNVLAHACDSLGVVKHGHSLTR